MDEEVEELRSRVKNLEELLGKDDECLTVFRLPPAMNELLRLLIATSTVTPAMMRRLKIVTESKVTIMRLRKHLRGWDIKINCSRKTGYWISDEDKERVRTGTVTRL